MAAQQVGARNQGSEDCDCTPGVGPRRPTLAATSSRSTYCGRLRSASSGTVRDAERRDTAAIDCEQSLPDTMCDGGHAACFLTKMPEAHRWARLFAAEADGELEQLAAGLATISVATSPARFSKPTRRGRDVLRAPFGGHSSRPRPLRAAPQSPPREVSTSHDPPRWPPGEVATTRARPSTLARRGRDLVVSVARRPRRSPPRLVT